VGEIDVYHLNHHGSSHSSSLQWLTLLNPLVTVGSCGVDNSYGHPNQEVCGWRGKSGEMWEPLLIFSVSLSLTLSHSLPHHY
jgi:beta-lactamase superfamily II metal-dependent hydrolase